MSSKEDGIEICNQLAKYAPDGECDKGKSTDKIKEVLDLIESAHIVDSKSKDITNSPAICPTPPMMYREGNKSGNMSVSQRATEAQLNKARETYEKCVENLENNQKELTEVLVTMRNCELKEIDFKTTIEMLVKGMDAIKEQWEKMVHFFQMVSNIVKTSLSKTQMLSDDVKIFSYMLYSSLSKTQMLSDNVKIFSYMLYSLPKQ
ncbi:hypothetical protein ROHU_019503 [Labeo rohita]|uniref:Uncharacterized protein n=1 Tax=Labeo rohita TaxID=84645 RepID=A0A498NE91_LABRO|nr:hypothetical protein ROHU_019503 [Labeo rohita]